MIHLLPIVIMAESLVAAIVYATQCKWWPALYGCAAGLLNLKEWQMIVLVDQLHHRWHELESKR